MSQKIKILFNAFADQQNTNAQSLIAADIASRLNPNRFESTLFLFHEPKTKLADKENIRFIKLPGRLGSVIMAAHLLWGGHDIVFYPPQGRVFDIYRLFKPIRKRKKMIFWVEVSARQLKAAPLTVQNKIANKLKDADICFANSPYVAETMWQEFGIKMDVMPLGVDVEAFCNRKDFQRENQKPVKVLNLATIQERKQTHVILDLAKRIPPEMAEFHIYGYVIGDPGYMDHLLKRKADEKLDHVFFHGKVVHSDLPEVLRSHDIFVLPSRLLEGVPRITLEAAASGLPCIVFDDYKTPSVIDGETGFQVKTVEQMAEKLTALIQNPELRHEMGIKGAAHARSFNWENVVKSWETVFEKLLSGKV